MRLCVLHNLYFYNHLMEQIREAIDEGRYSELERDFRKSTRRTDIMILLSSNGAGSILLLVGYIAIFAAIMYFAAIKPQKKQQKKQQEMLNSMEKGDSVLTTSGFYGVVIDITDDTVIVEIRKQ